MTLKLKKKKNLQGSPIFKWVIKKKNEIECELIGTNITSVIFGVSLLMNSKISII